MTNEATITIPIPDQLCLDFLTTAAEGGSTYWLACDKVERGEDHNVTAIIGCCDAEDETTTWGDANITTIRTGIQRICSPTFDIGSHIRADVLSALIDPDSTSWDAETADCVLQAGLFGEIVYG